MSSSITYLQRRRFVIAHELGHLEIHRDVNQLEACDEPEWFVAASLRDPQRTDFAGRQIQHFFIYILEPEGDHKSFASNWARELLTKLNPAFDAVFEEKLYPTHLSLAEVLRRGKLLNTVAKSMPEKISLQTSTDSCDWKEIPDVLCDG